MILYPFTIFLSAFLLFQLQPLIAKHILPWYGGGPGVWTACMLFFQVFLLLGYGYAHALDRFVPRWQGAIHLAALALSLAFVSIAPGSHWQPTTEDNPTWHIIALLSTHVGVPFAALAATSPLVTRWFSRAWPNRSPYRLYALSNFGSLLALLSYPFVVEPALSLDAQEELWAAGYIGFAAACAAVSIAFLRHSQSASTSREAESSADEVRTGSSAPEPADIALWVALAATGSILLLATTNQVCQDLTVVPLLWILPLAIYLVSFIICFDHERWYRRALFLPLFGASAAAASLALHRGGAGWASIAIFALTLFAGTMVCHGELVRRKPDARHLTLFYLAVAAGGALGGLLVGGLAPRLFPGYWEFPIGLLSVGALAMICVRRDTRARAEDGEAARLAGKRSAISWLSAGVVFVAVSASAVSYEARQLSGALETTRTFFGITRVENRFIPPGETRVMRHGRIAHGSQFVSGPQRREPTAYFGRTSGVGVALRRYRALQSQSGEASAAPPALRVGIVGLGAGTLAAYGREGDLFRFYEIDPEVARVARDYFSYLDDSAARVEIVLGDARLNLERADEPAHFDLLILDAFSGDAVPVHLLTREAYRTYLSHLRPGGLLVFQVSNRYLDLGAVVRGLAREAGQQAVSITTTGDLYVDTQEASYVIATDNREFLLDPTLRVLAKGSPPERSAPLVWTDAFASLWTVVSKRDRRGRWHAAPNRGHFVVDRGDLLSVEDEVRVKTTSQALYADSEGKAAIVVITAPSLRAGGAGDATLAEFAPQLFRNVGLDRPEMSDALLVFVSLQDRQAGMLVTPSWPPELRAQLEQRFAQETLVALAEGRVSQGIAQFALGFERMARARSAAPPPSETEGRR